MGVIFGTVEYFEKEIKAYVANNRLKESKLERLKKITSELENELLYDFSCHERLRQECLKNLSEAYGKMIQGKAVAM
ncbi:hypothetical protein ABE29_22915 [Cytobacillus firmus]|uniref:Uncharacterized protein n=1 Tax=Cytobacillus firmus DS1 TaxID=1307436 RepID=W7LIV8_CYTFI|nr:hypothetical protein [Cytobacillus firmus]EWG12049.1 hypothetical protein PBF_04618 [Cytobacillus firmus DS1]MBG9545500.1 hypothetical protein [Cytobacillus firmus]MBG9551185.1 hypothetical protein [Cytobacillus firmus]MBG9557967.1 hypothetical protein [Cytobacillus firmus]MBG9577591.1 hypothetical protein [Cytobacillus firmus]